MFLGWRCCFASSVGEFETLTVHLNLVLSQKFAILHVNFSA